jgi:MFS family permease
MDQRFRAFIILCLVGGTAIFSSTLSKNPVLPILAEQIGAGKALIGLVAAASTVTGILTSLPAGILSDHWGRRPLFILSGVVFFSAPLLYFWIAEPWQLALVRVYHGLATAVFGPVAMAYVADLAPTRRGEKLGYYSSATLAGRALAPIAGGAILAFGDYRGVYALCAVIGAATLVGMFLLPGKSEKSRAVEAASPPSQSISSTISLVEILRNRSILVTSLAEAAQFFAFGALEAFLPLYALSVGVDKASVGLLFGAQVAVRTLGRPILGWLSDQHGRKLPVVAGLALTAVASTTFALTTSFLLMLVCSIFFGLGLTIAQAATSAFVADLAPARSRGTALGLMSTLMDVGQALGPVLLGLFLQWSGDAYLPGFALIGGLVLAAALAFVAGAEEKKQPALM